MNRYGQMDSIKWKYLEQHISCSFICKQSLIIRGLLACRRLELFQILHNKTYGHSKNASDIRVCGFNYINVYVADIQKLGDMDAFDNGRSNSYIVILYRRLFV